MLRNKADYKNSIYDTLLDECVSLKKMLISTIKTLKLRTKN